MRNLAEKKWSSPKDIGELGKFVWINKNEIIIPKAKEFKNGYQRDNPKVKRILANFHWNAFGALSIADRNGQYYCVDGGGRLTACRMRDDIVNVPCMVFKSLSAKYEAQIFLMTDVKTNISAMDTFNARLVAGEKNMIWLRNLINDSDRKLTKTSSRNTIACIGLLMKCADENFKLLSDIWPLLLELENDHQFDSQVISAIWYIAKKNGARSVTEYRVKNKLLKVGHEKILKQIYLEVSANGGGGEKVYAAGVLRIINKGRRDNFLTV